MEKSVYVSGSNYFQEKYLKEMIALLDEGKTIQVGIACIGHTRNNTEQENYKNNKCYESNKKITKFQ